MKIETVNRLYHGTVKKFRKFDLGLARSFKDFGKGFYLTTNYTQAQKWAQLNALKGNSKKTYIYSYKLDVPTDIHEWNILELLEFDKKWIDFITENRTTGNETEYDIIYDKMADNRGYVIGDTISKYAEGTIGVDDAIKTIKWTNGEADQFCFKNEKAISLLTDRETIIQFLDDGIWKQVKE